MCLKRTQKWGISEQRRRCSEEPLSLLTFLGKTRLRIHAKAKTSASNPLQRSERALMGFGDTAVGSQHVFNST